MRILIGQRINRWFIERRCQLKPLTYRVCRSATSGPLLLNFRLLAMLPTCFASLGGRFTLWRTAFKATFKHHYAPNCCTSDRTPIHTAGWAKSRRRTNHVILSLWHACDYLFGSGRGFPSARCHGRSLLLSLLAANTEKRTEKRLTARHLGRQWSARSVRVIRRRSRGQPALSLRNGPR